MKKSDNIYTYDNSFNGFLSLVYHLFYKKDTVADIQSSQNIQAALFSESFQIETNEVHARRVWNAIQKKNYSALKTIYFAFLSESNGIEMLLYRYIKKLFSNNTEAEAYCTKDELSRINQLANLVGREKRRMEHQLHLQSTDTSLKYAYIEPAFNVLPLLSRHFRSRYRGYPWIIFDRKRKYGIYADGPVVQMISSSFLSRNMSSVQKDKSKKNMFPVSNQEKTGELLPLHGKKLKKQEAFTAA